MVTLTFWARALASSFYCFLKVVCMCPSFATSCEVSLGLLSATRSLSRVILIILHSATILDVASTWLAVKLVGCKACKGIKYVPSQSSHQKL